MSRRKQAPDPGDGYRVRIYCDHGDKQPRADYAQHDGDAWILTFSEYSAEHDAYRIACRQCRMRIAVRGIVIRRFLDALRAAEIHSVSLQSMSPRLVGAPGT